MKLHTKVYYIFLFLAIFLIQNVIRVDASSVETFDDVINIKTFFTAPSLNITVGYLDEKGNNANNTKNITYKPNSSLNWGGSLNYKKFGITLSTKVNSEDDENIYGKTSYNDFQLYYYNRMFGIETYFQKYKGFYLSNPEDFNLTQGGPETIQPNLKAQTVGFNFFYNYNDDFSLNAAFSQTERQVKWECSFLLMLSFNYYNISNDKSLIISSEEIKYGSDSGYSGGKYKSVSLSPGFGISIPYNHYYFTLALFVGSGLMQKVDYTDAGNKDDIHSFLKVNVKLGLGYNGDRYYGGLYGQLDSVTSDKYIENSEPSVAAEIDVFFIEFFIGMRI